MINIQYMLRVAENAALDAAAAIMDVYRRGDIDWTMKPDASPLTRADKLAQMVIIRHLRRTGLPILSEEAAAMEYEVRKYWEHYWIVDPLDGTREFIHQLEDFTVNIALMEGDRPVAGVIHAPVNGVTWLGSKDTGAWKKKRSGIRQLPPQGPRRTIQDLTDMERLTVVISRSHHSEETLEFIKQFGDVHLISMGSSLKFMALADGKADLYPRLGTTMEWDTAAAHAILHAVNKGIYRMDLSAELQYNQPDLRNPFFVAF
ncbi:MAG TPA: 3'(2'),5'-bisphosphate nucleotidase CysQ [Puia sp.]|nr:3'(2'),5'-bisphosphate nucleotidase CysQ [Puia sp.]